MRFRLSPLWSGKTHFLRFFADDPAAPASGGPAAPAAPDTPAGFDFNAVFEPDGRFKDNWAEPFKNEIGDSKYFGTAFKPGKDGIRELVKHVKDLSSFKGRALIPKADADEAEWDKVWQAAGIPGKPEDYGLTLDGIEDPGFVEFAKKAGFLDILQKEFCAAKLPLRLAGPIANARLRAAMDRYNSFHASAKEAREKFVEPGLGKVKFDEAVKNGREALAKLYGHTAENQNAEFNALLETIDNAGLTDHPLIVGLLNRLHSKLNPGRILVTGSTRTSGQTGPGVSPNPSFAQAMTPLTLQQVTNR